MYINVEKILSTQAIDLKIVAGFEGVNRRIKSVNTMDNPDTLRWLTKGELILTTGYFIINDDNLKKNLVRELAEIGCSGLAIKTKRYISEIPLEMIEQANELNFPIMEISYEHSLSEVSSLIYKEIFKRQDQIIKESIDIHQKLTHIMLDGGGLDEISEAIYKFIDNPIFIFDNSWKLMSYCEGIEEIGIIKKLEILGEDKEFVSSINIDIDRYKEAIKKQMLINGKKYTFKIIPIIAMKRVHGYIMVAETNKKMKKIDYVAMEQATANVALIRMKEHAVEETKNNLRRDFFDDLLEGKIESINVINSLNSVHGLDYSKKHIIIVIRVVHSSDYILSLQERQRVLNSKKHIAATIEEIGIEINNRIISTIKGNEVICFVQAPEENKVISVKNHIKDIVDTIYNRVEKLLYLGRIFIGIGKISDNILNIGVSYCQAIEAIQRGINLNKEGAVFHFEDFTIYNLLDMEIPLDKLGSFCNDTIGELLEYDEHNNSDMLLTLEEYFNNNCNITETANKLFIHRNTLVYRLDKIKDILSTDLKDPDQNLEFQLAIRGLKILKNKEK